MDLCRIFQNVNSLIPLAKAMRKMYDTGYGEVMEDIKRKVSFSFGHCLN